MSAHEDAFERSLPVLEPHKSFAQFVGFLDSVWAAHRLCYPLWTVRSD